MSDTRATIRPAGVVLVLLGLVAGALFFTSLDRLWPLADFELVVEPGAMERQARGFLEGRGFDLDGCVAARRTALDHPAIDYVDRTFGRERTQSWIAEGLPLLRHRVRFKRADDPEPYLVDVHPSKGVLGFGLYLEEDTPGARLEQDAARELALRAMRDGLGLDPAAFEERSATTTARPERVDHGFSYERLWNTDPELRERVQLRVAGDRVVGAWRMIIVPGPARRAARAAEAPGRALEMIGFSFLIVAAVGAFFVFLRKLRDGSVDLAESSVWPTAVFVCLMLTFFLQGADRFAAWETLWPRWVSDLRFLVFRAIEQIWVPLLLLAVVAAGYALDRESGAGRGRSLALLGRGRILDPSVGLASLRGFLVGLLCGGALAGSVIVLGWITGGGTSLQPRGFFLYPLDSAAPAATTLLFFLGVALAEEIGYRFFGGTWLLHLTNRRWLAITLPALIYGLTHTRLDFLPPADPFWARALALTLVGAVWGWAFLRFDALTVVLSHFTADLFIFNWPRLASDRPVVVATSLAVMLVPLLPGLLWLVRGRPGKGSPESREAAT
ncbi:MAG: CPBP family intramembrane metalloprotease [bacterium]|nr:CPBP family intramembrane metalloprotease [bacterium]